MPDFDLPGRSGGLTHVIDKGLGPRAWEDVLETSGVYIDVVKLGWGTAYVTPNLKRKLEVLREKPVVIGGTFFEVVYVMGKVDEYKAWLRDLGLLELFAEKAEHRDGLRRLVDFPSVIRHLSASLKRELDFRSEAANVDRLAEVLERYRERGITLP